MFIESVIVSGPDLADAAVFLKRAQTLFRVVPILVSHTLFNA